LGAFAGAVAGRLFLHEARRGRSNIARALPELTGRERERILRAHFRHLGRSVAEYLSYTGRNPARALGRVRFSGLEKIREAVARGKGVVVLTGHFGNWEMAAAAFAQEIPGTAVVARELYDINLSRFVDRMRARFGITTFDNRDSIAVYRHLRKGGVLFTLVDQESRKVANVPVSIFGVSTSAPSGPVLLAARAGSALFSGFTCPDPAGHLALFEEMPPVHDGDAPGDALAGFNRRLEAAVRKWPEAWVWLNARWGKAPDAAAGMLRKAAAVIAVAALFGGCGGGPDSGPGSTGHSGYNRPSAVMRGVRLFQVVKGRTEVEIYAVEAVQARGGGWVDGSDVRVVYHNKDGGKAVLHATTARYYLTRKVLEASGRVRVEAENGNLEATDLVWDAGKGSLTSRGFVKVTKGDNVLTGTGLEADPGLEQVVIKENVRILAREPGELKPLVEKEGN
jgi:KDO2-lipid IV(A) lauroyltransferase